MPIRSFIFPVGLFLILATAHAQNFWVPTTTGDWFSGPNWSTGAIPTSASIATIKTGGTAVISQAGAVANNLNLGPGSLLIQSGGVLNNSYSYLNGALVVEGAESALNTAQSLTVGYAASGSLTVRQGGTVSSSLSYLNYVQNGTVTANIEGTGSLWTVTGLQVNYGATLTVSDHGAISDSGNFSISGGTVLITGAESHIEHSGDFAINGGTQGQITIESGGALTSLRLASLDGNDTAQFVITGSGSKWTHSGAFTLYRGMLKIQNGGTASNGSASLNKINSSVGRAIVDGNGSKWTLASGLLVKGELTVSNGGKVLSSLGTLSGSPVVSIEDEDSSWTSSGDLEVQGTLSISNGALLQNVIGKIGSQNQGEATVTGEGSSWSNSADLRIGTSTVGKLSILNGGEVSNENAYLGYYGSGTSTANISGSGSLWKNRGDLYVGYYSSNVPGTVTIADSGCVEIDGGVSNSSTGTMWLGYGANTNGTLTIGSDGPAGILKASAVSFSNSNGKVVFKHTDPTYTFSPSISGPGTIRHEGSGLTILAGVNSGFTGSTTITAGSLLVAGTLGGSTSTISVSSGATLGGSGQLGVITLNSGASLKPGGDGGDSTLAATTLKWNGGASLQMDLGSQGTSDKIMLSGSLTKQSGSGFIFDFKLGSNYPGPTSYDIATFSNTSFTKDDFSVSGLVTGTFEIVNGNTLRFTTTTPRPTIISSASTPTPSVVDGSASLSVLGSDPDGEQNLLYAWSSTGPAQVTFSSNLSNAAKNTSAVFSKQGTYAFTVVVSNAAGASRTSSITVSVEQRFEWWTGEHDLANEDALANADTDHDGVVNLLEYALGMDPLITDLSFWPTSDITNQQLSVTYPKLRSDLIYQPEWSINLTDWNTESITLENSDDMETATISVEGKPQVFMRLRVNRD